MGFWNLSGQWRRNSGWALLVLMPKNGRLREWRWTILQLCRWPMKLILDLFMLQP